MGSVDTPQDTRPSLGGPGVNQQATVAWWGSDGEGVPPGWNILGKAGFAPGYAGESHGQLTMGRSWAEWRWALCVSLRPGHRQLQRQRHSFPLFQEPGGLPCGLGWQGYQTSAKQCSAPAFAGF